MHFNWIFVYHKKHILIKSIHSCWKPHESAGKKESLLLKLICSFIMSVYFSESKAIHFNWNHFVSLGLIEKQKALFFSETDPVLLQHLVVVYSWEVTAKLQHNSISMPDLYMYFQNYKKLGNTANCIYEHKHFKSNRLQKVWAIC